MSRRQLKRVVAIVVPCTVLILGLVSIELFLVHPGAQAAPAKWRSAGTIALGRYSFQATTLQNGIVLIEGGFAPGSYTPESELYNPATNSWTSTGNMNEGRGEHSATLLPNGKVLVAGGYNGSVLNTAELYDPATGTWAFTGSMSEVRTRDTETLLSNGNVLAAGGWNGGVTAGAEIYDPSTGSWSSAGHMTTPRTNHVAVLLPNGKVLVAGGEPVNGGTSHTAAAELYDPTTDTWSPTGSTNVGRSLFTAVLLPSGKVLAAGGCTDSGGTATAELYDPGTGTWTLTGSMQYARCLSQGQHAVVLASGNVLIAGGESSGTSQEYDPATGTWTTPVSMGKPRCGGATAALQDGRVLLVGGDDCVSSNNLVLVAQAYKSSHKPCRSGMGMQPRCTKPR